MQQITLLLADDHAVVRQSLRALLEAEEDIRIVGESENGWQTVHMVKRLKPEVVILDLEMPSLNGLEAARQIRKDSPNTKVLILSCYSNDEYARQLAEIGGAGYLVKQATARELVRAIREVKRGNTFFSAVLSGQASAPGSAGTRPCGKRPPPLTPREGQVLQLIAEGNSSKRIAETLFISSKTVGKHRTQLMRKLNIHSTAGLTRYAIARGVIENQPSRFNGGHTFEGSARQSRKQMIPGNPDASNAAAGLVRRAEKADPVQRE
jgi:DNA-binding NarL/FixJ family response regulator